jgi:hypothetical protein
MRDQRSQPCGWTRQQFSCAIIPPIVAMGDWRNSVRNEAVRVAALGDRWARRILVALAIAVASWPAAGARGAVTVDAVTSRDAGRFTSSFSFTHTVGSGPTRLLIVAVIDGNRSSSVTALTYGGVNLTKIDRAVGTGVAAELWRLIAPVSGTNAIALTMSNNQDRPIATAISYTGVDQGRRWGLPAPRTGPGRRSRSRSRPRSATT